MAAVGLLCASAANASADGSVTLPGSPLVVSVGSLGECQSSYPNVGTNFFPPASTVGDCGFFLAFPAAGSGQPAQLREKVFGFQGSAGPGVPLAEGGAEYTAIEQGPATGTGTSADPYTESTKYKVALESKDYALITDTTSYVNGQPQFTLTYTVQNVGTEKLYFHAIVAGDLYVANDDHGTGVFLGGPPKFLGGQNPNTGTLGGFVEATPAWDDYQEGFWDGPVPYEPTIEQDKGIWNAVRIAAKSSESVFNNTIDPNLIDNGAGVSWDDHLKAALEPGKSATYSIVARSQVPTTLGVQPVTQSHTVGQTGTVTVTATDNVGTPYAGRPLVYSIGGSNPKTGSVTTNAAGVATISYVGTAAGLDTMQMFLDLNGNGAADTGEPSAAAQLVWTPAPPTPSGSYTIQSIKANSDGTVTIVFVPVQEGTGTVEVTVPTATISRNASIAKAKKCKKSQIKIHGKCRPKTSVSGKVSARGKAGVPLKITVKPSSKVKKALAKGKKVQLTAKLMYKSVLGGAPVAKTYHFTVKAKKKKKKGHR
ncbi:MAG TPA: Ig-like domain-containing protein [Solirubrobacteraceae bacterium]|nr:Ig-like domain-containing protein [Solirubrobacteraceae bacterium]